MLKLEIIGERLRGLPATEAAYFYGCKACGQPVDKRDLGAVLHHEERGHAPLPDAEAFRLVDASMLLDHALKERG